MRNYDAQSIEKKWQQYWQDNNTYTVADKAAGKENFYALSEFAYPSGNLHVGHWYAFAVPDIYARYKRMSGYNVLYPMGFDAFGLPAENAAIKRGLDPRKWTYENMDYMKNQLKSMGASFDWNRTLATCDPEYYKWTQWMFTQCYANDLIERSTTKTNWCESCKTVLANEQVVNGACERCDNEVVQRDMAQWMLKITEFADDLVDDLESLDWDHSIKQAQREWIGRKEGSLISFPIKNEKRKVILLHGKDADSSQKWYPQFISSLEKDGFNVFAPDLPNASSPVLSEWLSELDKLSLDENTVLVGHSRGGVAILRWLEKKNIKVKKVILIAANDGRSKYKPNNETNHGFYTEKGYDFEKIKKSCGDFVIYHSKDDKWVSYEAGIANQKGLDALLHTFEDKGHFGKDLGKVGFPEILNEFSQSINVFTTRADTLFGATYVVLAPEHELVKNLKSQILNWDEVEQYLSEVEKKSDLDRQQSKEKTGVQLRGIEAINPATETSIPVWVADYVLAHFGTGAVMAVPAHDERDCEFAIKYDLPFKFVVLPSAGEMGNSRPLVTSGENAFILAAGTTEKKGSQEQINAEWNAMYDILAEVHNNGGILPRGKRFCCTLEGKVINASAEVNTKESAEARTIITDMVNGKNTKTYRLRDWGISRQRYWGTPIPMVYDQEGNPHPVPEEHLPWILPEDVDFTPDGTAPLARSEALKKRTEEIFGAGWTPEVDTMDTFVDSSWYFYRYLDSKNDTKFASDEALKSWMPVDMYFGGAEHTTMHLLYSRFWVKALHRLGLVPNNEPYKGRLNRGLILGPDGAKMSKSKGNVIDPDEVVSHVGADTVRMYLAFIGPFNEPGNYPWDPNGVVGVRRFIERVFGLGEKVSDESVSTDDVLKLTHKTIKKVTADVERLKLNTAISAMMVLVNALEKEDSIGKLEYESLLKMFGAFAPHIAEEIWQEHLGNKESIHLTDWPQYDEDLCRDDELVLGVQVNGKVRAEVILPADADENQAREITLAHADVQKWIDGKEIRKFIYVQGRIINIVV